MTECTYSHIRTPVYTTHLMRCAEHHFAAKQTPHYTRHSALRTHYPLQTVGFECQLGSSGAAPSMMPAHQLPAKHLPPHAHYAA
jgi:hypothetical protein